MEIEASEWLVAMSDRTVSLDRHAEFQAWLRQDPEHERVYGVQKAAFHAVSGMPHLLEEERSAKTNAIAVQRRNWRYVAAASVMLVLGAAIFAASSFFGFGAGSDFETATAQVKDVRLDDGTLVTLGAESRMTVEFHRHERRVQLMRGEAFFEVARDSTRPFFVSAGDTVVRVLGTQFDVHYGEKAVRVAVLEGRVEVVKAGRPETAASAPVKRRTLTAGEAVVTTQAGEIAVASPVAQQELGAWRQGRLVYVDTRLRDVVADLRRYYDGEIELADEAVGDMQLTVAFRADQLDGALAGIEAAIPVQARHEGRRIVFSAR